MKRRCLELVRGLVVGAALLAAPLLGGCTNGGTDEVQRVDFGTSTESLCWAFCADGQFVCPPNPWMECYWECTMWCPYECDEGEELPACF